jgi:16S rRNA (guanine527-N7)-methyltransferase
MTDILRGGLAKLRDSDSDIAALIDPRFDETAALLEKYLAEIELFNDAYGLVSARNREDLVVRHILDSLSPLGIIVRALAGTGMPAIADAGSGAGLPGIPLAVCLSPLRAAVTLIDRMGRRAGFLRNTLAVLRLPGLEAEEAEIEKARGGRFDMVVFRAFRPLQPAIYRALARLLRTGDGDSSGGILAAYKGRTGSVAGEMRALEQSLKKEEAPRSWEAPPCPVPFLNEERCLLLIQPPAKRTGLP